MRILFNEVGSFWPISVKVADKIPHEVLEALVAELNKGLAALGESNRGKVILMY